MEVVLRRKIVLLLLGVFLIGSLSMGMGCGKKSGQGDAAKGPIVVASKIDTEGALLGKIIIFMLTENGFQVEDQTEFGSTDLVRKALVNAEIDVYPEYTGNGAFFFDSSEPSLWKDKEKGWNEVRKLDWEQNRVVWLQCAPANNTWAIAGKKDLLEKENIKTMEDFAEFVNKGGEVKLACSEEFIDSPAALPAFEKAYGFTLEKDQLLSFSGGNTAQTEKAAAEGTDGVNFAMAYGTDGNLAAFRLVILEDSLNVQPVYAPCPVIRGKVQEQYPEIAEILKPVFDQLDDRTLQSLNSRIAVEGQPAGQVALFFLKEKGFVKDE
ncbi:MAG: ABC transporter substrate-binding protein [Bacillota bacterium]|nr:ABC transporter substrate-binding protein [Bacillota bacterium]